MDALPAKMHREWRTRRETVRAWRRVARNGTDGTAVDENEAKADKIDEIDAFARAISARGFARAFVVWESSRARRASRVRASRARARRTTARSSRAHTPGVARRDVARAASTRAPRARRRFPTKVRRFRRVSRVAPPRERRRVAARLAEALDAARDAAMESRAFAEWRATVARERTREAVALARFRRDAEPTNPTRRYAPWTLVSDSRRSKRLRRRAARAHRDRVVVSTATRSWAAWVAYASDVRAKALALASRFSRVASRRTFARGDSNRSASRVSRGRAMHA